MMNFFIYLFYQKLLVHLRMAPEPQLGVGRRQEGEGFPSLLPAPR